MNKFNSITYKDSNTTTVVFDLDNKELPNLYEVNLPIKEVIGRTPHSLAEIMLANGVDCQPLVDYLSLTIEEDSIYYLASSFSTIVNIAEKGREIINNFGGGSIEEITEVILLVKPIIEVYNVLVEEKEKLKNIMK